MKKLELYIPKLEDLWFYQKMMSDPETMSYNAGWDVDFDGYHRDTGCIDYPDEVLSKWYANWVGQEPDCFYAYIKRSTDGAWIGDVNFHYTPEKDWWDMGIVIYAPFRGKGYAVPALRLLLDQAFRICGISRLHNDFETTRDAAWAIHRKVGFKEMGVEDRIITIADATALAHGCTAKTEFFRQLPPLVNDPALSGVAIGTAEALYGKENLVVQDVMMGSEDFSLYSKIAPTFMYHMGIGGSVGLHNCNLVVPDHVTAEAAELLSRAAIAALEAQV